MERYEMTTETRHYGLDGRGGRGIQYVEATESKNGENKHFSNS